MKVSAITISQHYFGQRYSFDSFKCFTASKRTRWLATSTNVILWWGSGDPRRWHQSVVEVLGQCAPDVCVCVCDLTANLISVLFGIPNYPKRKERHTNSWPWTPKKTDSDISEKVNLNYPVRLYSWREGWGDCLWWGKQMPPNLNNKVTRVTTLMLHGYIAKYHHNQLGHISLMESDREEAVEMNTWPSF